MPQIHPHNHAEEHFTGSEIVRDIVIGMADGLTVPFALAAGLSAAVSSTGIVVTAGLAEIVAGSIAMGLGGFLAARTEQEHYAAEEAREYWEVDNLRQREIDETVEIFEAYGLSGDNLKNVVDAVAADKKRWVDFMMRFELGLEKPDPKRAPISAGTIGASYIVGGLIPLAPYMMYGDIHEALPVSVVMTGIALVVFGAVKARFTGLKVVKTAIQTLVVGGLAAGAAYYLASLFG
ncbi:MAG: VIT1/CCC1 transporter family protein [Rhodospirillales bacterium]|nr:VIT1/CCC1 transporter family protein [Alphaproteobacteria bacterium]MCB9986071.1 VIT1/CCC1 transporter family protein [Rhodospirillales bacterium]USO07362.1 MAG: VIT1/CCC1 transporter family protein [Rhodospirillales bacterium]